MRTLQTKKENLKVCSDIEKLAEPFRSEVIKLLSLLETIPETKILCVFETIRTPERQKYLYDLRRTKTFKSKHLIGHAVDLVPHTKKGWSWADRDITGDGTTKDEMLAFKKMRQIVKSQFPKLTLLGEWDMAHVELRG